MPGLRSLFVVTALLLAGCASSPPSDISVPGTALPDLELPPALAADLADPWAYETLGDLCTVVGHRLAGSPGMERAAAWAVTTLRAAGFDSVWTEPVTLPHWTRGREWARCAAPVPFDLTISGLGLSDGTPPEGIEAELVVVGSFDELDARAAEVAGRMVLFDAPWQGYGPSVQFRVHGASRAARHGAVAVLVRSVTPTSLATPHTGMMAYADSLPRVPACAVTVEDAARLRLLAGKGERPRIHLMMEASNRGETVCRNVVGEIRGASLPDEIVLLGGHLDSWDVGTGAHDDGAGCIITLAAARRLLADGGRPDRTVRVVLFTGEELGGHGGDAYLEAHRHELGRHVAALESDSGCFAPDGFSVQGDSLVVARVAELAAPLAPLGADRVRQGWSGVDIRPICNEGVPGIGHRVRDSNYFDYHHSPADTFDKIDPDLMARNVAAVAGLLRALVADPVPLADHAAPVATD